MFIMMRLMMMLIIIYVDDVDGDEGEEGGWHQREKSINPNLEHGEKLKC